jgi:acetyltransferase-like isoleucine patch superfamily enzyme
MQFRTDDPLRFRAVNLVGAIRVLVARSRSWLGLVRVDLRLLCRGHTLMYPLRVTGAARQLERLLVSKNVAFQRDVKISLSPETSGVLLIGENSYVGDGCFLSVHASVNIGSNVMIGAYSYITSAVHRIADANRPMISQGFAGRTVNISDDVWIGTGSIILPGVTVGKGSVIGAGSVVTKDVPSMEIWGGVPAQKIRSRELDQRSGAA